MNAPKLRFKGFNNKWEENKLNNLFSIRSSSDLKQNELSKIYSDIYCYPVYGNSISNEGLMGYYPYYEETAPALTVTGRGVNIGTPFYRNTNFNAIGRLLVLYPLDNNYDSYFFGLEISRFSIFTETTGVPQLTAPAIGNYKVWYPVPQEQKKISNFFLNLNKKIQLQQEKIDLLKLQKKGLMQKIFSQELRFKDENGQEYPEWREKNLEELCNINTGNKDTQNKIEGGLYPFFVRSQVIERISTYSFDGEAILTAGDGVGVGKVFHYINGKFDYHQRVYMLSDFKDCIGKYIYYYFTQNFMKEAMKYNAKTSVDSVRREMLTKMMFPYPFIEEQQKIADFLSATDLKISMESQKLEQLQFQKQAFMQQMFI